VFKVTKSFAMAAVYFIFCSRSVLWEWSIVKMDCGWGFSFFGLGCAVGWGFGAGAIFGEVF
jgi:hypothetical protein